MNEAVSGLQKVQAIVDEWISRTDCGYFSPLTNMAVLAEETGEVARVLASTDGDRRAKPADVLNLADELADVLWVVAAIANQHGIDLGTAFADNITKKTTRDRERFHIKTTPDSKQQA